MNNSHYEESMRRMMEARKAEYDRMVYESIYSPSSNQNQVGDGSAAGSGGGGNPDQNSATPFGFVNVLDFGGPGGFPTQQLNRLYSDGSKVPLDNQPEIFDSSTFPAFSEKTHDGFVYVACPRVK